MCLASKIGVYLYKIIQVQKMVSLTVSKVRQTPKGAIGDWSVFYYQAGLALLKARHKPARSAQWAFHFELIQK